MKKVTKKNKNGDTYVGEMKNDKPHGYGTYTWPNGEKYVGGTITGSRQANYQPKTDQLVTSDSFYAG